MLNTVINVTGNFHLYFIKFYHLTVDDGFGNQYYLMIHHLTLATKGSIRKENSASYFSYFIYRMKMQFLYTVYLSPNKQTLFNNIYSNRTIRL